MTKIKILYTIPNFDTAGSGKVLYDLAKNLNPDYFEVSIACKHDKGAFFKSIEALGLPIYILDSTVPLRPYYNLLSRIDSFKAFIKTHQFDIVHSWHWSSDWSEVLATRMTGSKFVYTKKAMSWGNIHWKIRSFLSDYIITVNSDMKSYFPYKKNQQLIPFGLDMTYYSSEFNEIKRHEKKIKIITIANLVPVKNIEVIIKALKKLTNPNIHLDILGENIRPYAENLKQLVIDLDLEKHVSFLGKQADVRSFLANADLYVISSKKEGMPMALIEAMAMGVPVLGSDVPGIRYVLKEFKELLFDLDNIELLSQKIDLFYYKTKDERTELGKELREYCLSNFSINAFVNAHETLYLKLLNKKRS